MSEYEEKKRRGWTGSLEELARRRLILCQELHRRYGLMPSATYNQRARRVRKFLKYTRKYPHGISHPELFEE